VIVVVVVVVVVVVGCHEGRQSCNSLADMSCERFSYANLWRS